MSCHLIIVKTKQNRTNEEQQEQNNVWVHKFKVLISSVTIPFVSSSIFGLHFLATTVGILLKTCLFPLPICILIHFLAYVLFFFFYNWILFGNKLCLRMLREHKYNNWYENGMKKASLHLLQLLWPSLFMWTWEDPNFLGFNFLICAIGTRRCLLRPCCDNYCDNYMCIFTNRGGKHSQAQGLMNGKYLEMVTLSSLCVPGLLNTLQVLITTSMW